MNPKLLLPAILLGGLTLFFWGALAHMLPPEPVTTLTDPAAVDDFVAKHAPANGGYMDPRGVVIFVGFEPGRPDKTQNMGRTLGIEFLSNCLQAVLLLLILMRMKLGSIGSYGIIGAALGLLIWMAADVSNWAWYSMPPAMILMAALDAIGGNFLAACVIGWLIRKNFA